MNKCEYLYVADLKNNKLRLFCVVLIFDDLIIINKFIIVVHFNFSAKRIMLKRCVDFSAHMKKQSLAVECPVGGASTKEVLDLKDMVWYLLLFIADTVDKIHFYSLKVEIGNKQNADHAQKILNLKEENKLLNETLKELTKSNLEKIIQKNIDDCSKKKNVSSAE